MAKTFQSMYDDTLEWARHKRDCAMALGIPIVEQAMQQSGYYIRHEDPRAGSYNRYGDPFDYVNNLQPITLNAIKHKDGSIVVEAYHDPYQRVYHIIYKEVDGLYLYILKNNKYEIIYETKCMSVQAARNEMKSLPNSHGGAIDGRWSGEKDMYIKSHFKPVKIVEHELTYVDYVDRLMPTKKSFKKQLEEEVSGWCKGILNGLL